VGTAKTEMNMNTPTPPNLLAQTLFEAQCIAYEGAAPMANKRAALDRLARLLCTPVVTSALMDAGITKPAA
jgi:hypothetical protein